MYQIPPKCCSCFDSTF